MDRDTARLIEWDCTQLIYRFYGCLDEKRYTDLASLFLPDGAWVRLGRELIGPEAILAAMGEREDWLTAHVVTNVRITPVGVNRAESVQYVTLYRIEDHDPASGPAEVVLPLGILRHADTLQRVDEAWKFARKTSRALMTDRSRVTHYDTPKAPA